MNPSQFIDGRDLRIAGLEAQNEALAARVAALEGVVKAADQLAMATPVGENAYLPAYREARAKLKG